MDSWFDASEGCPEYCDQVIVEVELPGGKSLFREALHKNGQFIGIMPPKPIKNVVRWKPVVDQCQSEIGMLTLRSALAVTAEFLSQLLPHFDELEVPVNGEKVSLATWIGLMRESLCMDEMEAVAGVKTGSSELTDFLTDMTTGFWSNSTHKTPPLFMHFPIGSGNGHTNFNRYKLN